MKYLKKEVDLSLNQELQSLKSKIDTDEYISCFTFVLGFLKHFCINILFCQ